MVLGLVILFFDKQEFLCQASFWAYMLHEIGSRCVNVFFIVPSLFSEERTYLPIISWFPIVPSRPRRSAQETLLVSRPSPLQRRPHLRNSRIWAVWMTARWTPTAPGQAPPPAWTTWGCTEIWMDMLRTEGRSSSDRGPYRGQMGDSTPRQEVSVFFMAGWKQQVEFIKHYSKAFWCLVEVLWTETSLRNVF